MEVPHNNGTYSLICQMGTIHYVTFTLIDMVTFLTGQPVIAKLLWIVFKSKKTIDVLNCNLALFHNLQHFISILHLLFLFLWEKEHMKVVKFLFVYVETGGPMSLTFICLERYFAVIHPTSYPLLKKYRFRELCASSVWLMSLPTAFLTVFIKDSIPSKAEFVLRNLPSGIMGVMTAMMVWCSHKIAKKLKKSGPGRDVLHPVKKKALRTIRATSIIIVLCYTPVSFLQNFTYENERLYNCMSAPLCILFLSAASVVHPLFYLSTQGQLFTCSRGGRKSTNRL